MTPSKKLFIAATLLAAGYGLAALLGAPDPRLWPDTLTPVGPSPSKETTAMQGAAGTPVGPSMVGSVRLLPDPAAAKLDALSSTESSVAAAPRRPEPPGLAAAPPAAQTPATFIAEPSAPLLTKRSGPRAMLKNESPRPLPTTDRPTSQGRGNQVDATAYAQPVSAPQANANNNVWPAGFASDAAMAPVPSIRATDEMPMRGTQPLAPVSPPPWPMVEAAPPRTHVIIDGDSLAKLAGRYLEDPRRSEEIFALNRGVLSDPELLPIGLELKIPPRGRADDAGVSRPQSRLFGSPSVHSAEHTGLVPVRSLPAASGVMPRAQLLPPMRVE